jgi:hypothetical protein
MVKDTGAHSIIYSTNPDADRALLRHVFKLPRVYQPRHARPRAMSGAEVRRTAGHRVPRRPARKR